MRVVVDFFQATPMRGELKSMCQAIPNGQFPFDAKTLCEAKPMVQLLAKIKDTLSLPNGGMLSRAKLHGVDKVNFGKEDRCWTTTIHRNDDIRCDGLEVNARMHHIFPEELVGKRDQEVRPEFFRFLRFIDPLPHGTLKTRSLTFSNNLKSLGLVT